MDAKTLAPETMPHDSNPSGSFPFSSSFISNADSSIDSSIKYGDSTVANNGAAAGVGGSGDNRGEEGFESASEKPTLSVKTPERAGSFLSPMPKDISDDVGGGDEIVRDERVRVLKEEGLVGEVSESVEEAGGEGLEEAGGEGFLDRVANGGVDSGKVDFSVETGSNEKTISGEIEDKIFKESDNSVKGDDVTNLEKSDLAVESDENKIEVVGDRTEQKESVFNGEANVNDDYKLIEGKDVRLTKADSIVDSSTVESVHVDVANPGIVVVGDVKGSEESEAKEKEVSAVEKIVEADKKIDMGSETEPVSYKWVEAVDVKLGGEEGGSDVDTTVSESAHIDVAKPGVVVIWDVEGSEVPKVKDKEVLADENSVEIDNKFDQISRDVGGEAEPGSGKSVDEGDSVVHSSVTESMHVGDVEGIKETDVTQTGLDTEELDDLTAACAGNLEFVAEKIVEAVKEKPIEQKYDVTETKDHVDESSNVGLGDKEEKPVAEAVSEVNAKTNTDVGEVLSREKVDEEEDEDRIQVKDTVSKRWFGIEAGEGDAEGLGTDGENGEMISEAAKQFLEELEKASSGLGSHSGTADSLKDRSQRIEGQIVTDSDEEVDTDEEGEGRELFDSTALAALLKAATGGSSDGGNITITSQDGSRLFSVERPAGLGSSLRSVRPAAPRTNRPNIFSHPSVTAGEETENNLSEEEIKKLEKLQSLRVKFLRLVHKLGHSAEDSIAAQVLYRLTLLAGRQTGEIFSLESAKRTATELEAEGKDGLDFSLTVLVLGKAGVGKSATINSILGDQKALIDAFEPATTAVKEVTGIVDRVKITVFDTPGLKSSAMEQSTNRKLLSSVKKVIKKCPPDIVLYVDRLDSQTRDLNDLPLLRTITSSLGSSIWKNAIVTLTHAASAPPDGPSGSPLSYEVFVAQRSHIVQQSIGQAVGDLRLMNPSLMNPVSLVENHPSCRKNRDGQKVLPNGQTWRPQLLLLCYSMKILSEATALSKPQDPVDHRRLFGFRVRSPPLPYLLSWLLQSRSYPKLPADQGGDSVDSDVDIDDMSDSDNEDNEEDEYDQLPPFKPLRKAQLAKLSREQKKAYFEEYDYRVKLLQKKQWREELKRMKEMKKKGKAVAETEFGYLGEEEDAENGAPAAVPVPLPDMVLPPSFDGDNPAHRYRFLEPTSQLLTRPVLDTHGWDHDCGYDGVNVEHSLALASRFPAAVSVQVTKDKKDFSIHLDSSISTKHGENGSTMAGFDIQNVGKQLAYVVRGETKFKNLKKNKTGLGGSVTFLGENIATGVKLEDQIAIGKRVVLVGSTGTVRSKDDSAYGANLEIRLREADFPIGQDQSSLGLSLVKWRGDLALGANLQSQVSVGRNSKVAIRAGLNNKMSGQITVRTSSSDQLQIALAGFLPIVMAIYKSIRSGTSEKYSMY